MWYYVVLRLSCECNPLASIQLFTFIQLVFFLHFRSYQRQDSNYMSRQRQPDSGCSSPVRSPISNMITTPANSSSNLTQVKFKFVMQSCKQKTMLTDNYCVVLFRCPVLRMLHWLQPSKRGRLPYLLLLFTNMLKPLKMHRRQLSW